MRRLGVTEPRINCWYERPHMIDHLENRPARLLVQRLNSSSKLLAVAKSLIGVAARVTKEEKAALRDVTGSEDEALVAAVRDAVRAGLDPLGDAYCIINTPLARRDRGQTFTPSYVVDGMLGWAKRQRKAVRRLVDPGAGSGRYTIAGLRAFPKATAVAVEMDPVVAVLLRANLTAAGLSDRAKIVIGDYRDLKLTRIDAATLFVGNPPYVRHHDIDPAWKAWYSRTLLKAGHEGSQLAGLHLHFFLKTLGLAREGDLGCYVTAAEWLDVKYGSALRGLLTNGLGGKDVFVVDPTVPVFGDAMVTAAITGFAPGSKRTELHFAEISTEEQVRALGSGLGVKVADAKAEPKWSFLIKGGRQARPEGFVELGEMFKVSRGQVTGLNRVWVQGSDTPSLPRQFLVPAITDSWDILRATRSGIESPETLRKLVCLPRDLAELSRTERAAVDKFLLWARSLGADQTYIARHRNPWWSVGCRDKTPPIVMTYMGRRPPAFAVNKIGAQLINVAHGLYPRQDFTEHQLAQIASWLNSNVSQGDGRVYAGGLTKFEPSEAMRILVPAEIAT